MDSNFFLLHIIKGSTIGVVLIKGNADKYIIKQTGNTFVNSTRQMS